MLKVNTGDQKVEVNWRRLPIGTGEGPTVFNIPGGFTPVVSQNFLTDTTVPSWLDVSATTGNRMLYDSTGKLTYAPNNLLLYSQTFSVGNWPVTNATKVSTTETAPDGTSTALLLQFSATGGRIGQASTLTSGLRFVFSVWVKVASGTRTFQVTDNAATPAVLGTINADTSWQRLFVAFSGTGQSAIRFVDNNASGFVDTYLWGAQLEAVTYQTTPSTYVATTTAAYYGPRFDYDPSTLAAKGLLIEESRANLLTYSEQFDNAAWPIGGILAWGSGSIANNAVSPDGTTTADKAVEDTSTGLHRTFRSFSATSGSSYAFTVYAKAAGRSVINMAYGGAGMVAGSASFDLSTGTVSNVTSATASITSIGNGWYRCSLVAAAAATNTGLVYVNLTNGTSTSYTGDGTSGVLLWGAQLEAGSFATSYIPTTTASVTRAADILKLTGTALTTLQGAAGTLLEEATILGNKAAAQYGVYGNTVSPLYWDSLVVKATNGTNVLSSAQTAVVGTAGRGGLAWNASGRAISFSASAAVTDANSFGTIGATVYLGSNNGANSLNGWVRALSFYNQRLSNATLATKTTVGGPL